MINSNIDNYAMRVTNYLAQGVGYSMMNSKNSMDSIILYTGIQMSRTQALERAAFSIQGASSQLGMALQQETRNLCQLSSDVSHVDGQFMERFKTVATLISQINTEEVGSEMQSIVVKMIDIATEANGLAGQCKIVSDEKLAGIVGRIDESDEKLKALINNVEDLEHMP